MRLDEKTIVAISTPVGRGAIGIVRLSGKESLNILSALVKKRRDLIKPRRVYFGTVYSSKGEVIDQVLYFYFKAPKSYTGEDMAEIHFHGNPLIGDLIVREAIELGARAAEPGEFTLRAFLNGKLDLTQAEAIERIISASSIYALSIANSQLQGALGEKIRSLYNDIITALSHLEVEIDYNEDQPSSDRAFVIDTLERVKKELERLLDSYHWAKKLMGDFKVLIVGRPNVGKSTLLNRIIGEERVITSPLPGTTRDYIEVEVILRGKSFKIIDTAGYRKAKDEIELKGIKLMFEKIKDSDLIFFVLDLVQGITKEDIELLEHLVKEEKTIWIILNKADIKRIDDKDKILEKYGNFRLYQISALHGWGIDKLKNDLAQFEPLKIDSEAISPLTSQRHYEAVHRSLGYINNGIKVLKEGYPPEIVAYELHESARLLGNILGIEVEDSLLDTIFSNFCVGK